MKKILLAFFYLSTLSVSAQEWRWAKDNGTYSILGKSQIEAHSSGDVYTAVTNTIWPSQVMFKKENTHGSLLWQKNLAGDNTFIVGLAVDKSNNSYLMGFFANNLVLPDTTYLNSGNYELFIVAYNTTGNRKWVKVIPNASNWSNAIGCDENGDIIYAAAGVPGSDSISVKKFSPAGNIIWEKFFPWNSALSGLTIDKLNNINLYGNFSGTSLVIDGNTYYSSSGTNYYWKSFIAKLNPEGEIKKVMLTLGTQIKDLDTDSSSTNYFFTGAFSDSALIGSTKIKTTCSTYHNNMCEEHFVARMDSNSVCHWEYVNPNTFKQIESTTDGKSYLSGTFSNIISLDGVALKETENRGSAFIYHFNKNGNVQWAVKDSGSYLTSNYVEDLTLDGTGSAYVSGTFHNFYGKCWFGVHELPLTGIQTHYFSAKLFDADAPLAQTYPEINDDYLFPNPSSGKFVSPEEVIRISDCLGKTIPFTRNTNGQEINLVASSGIYLVQLKNGKVLKLLIRE